jgi:TRAP-type mannitol/chloroaromatic compound transport system permease large subunit
MASQAPALAVSVALLAGVAACAWVLDAFEMIFVIVPIAAPLLVLRLGDAQQAAVLLLLVLQLSFLLPPLGYAVLIARSRSGLPPVSTRALLAAVAPFIGVQLLVGGAVLLHRPLVHLLDGESAAEATHAPRLSDEDVLDRMREMGPSPLTGDEPAPDAAPAASSAR